jgi:NADPH-dependent glutamate synthase beta subunit-like oxidoreductase
MPAIPEEVDDAEAEGVRLELMAAPQRVLRDDRGRVTGIELMRTRAGDYDASGRRIPVATGETFTLSCDNIIMAIGEKPEADPLRRAGVQIRENGTAAADGVTYETSRPRVHAVGDLVTGASNVSSTMATGKAAARALDRILTGRDRMGVILKDFTIDNTLSLEPQGGARNASPHVAPAGRRTSFEEVMKGFDGATAAAESVRCLRCDVKETCSRATAESAVAEA